MEKWHNKINFVTNVVLEMLDWTPFSCFCNCLYPYMDFCCLILTFIVFLKFSESFKSFFFFFQCQFEIRNIMHHSISISDPRN